MDKIHYYNERKAKPSTIWLLYLFLGWSYGSLGKIGLQILFYLTLGGLGLWAFIRLFTLSPSIKSYNRKIAIECGFDEKELVSMGLV